MTIQPDPNAPPSSTEPTTGTTSSENLISPPYRVPDSDPRPWARGKTYEEIATLADQAITGLYNIAMQPQQQPMRQVPQVQMGDEDIVDGKTVRGFVDQYAAPFAQQTRDLAAQNAQLAFAHVKNEDEFRDVFKKYEPEVLGRLNGIAPHQMTLDTIRMAARLVRGDHYQDLAREHAQQMMAQSGYAVRTDGFAVTPGKDEQFSLESDKLPARYRDQLQRAGIGINQVREFCATHKMTMDEWFKMAEKVPVMGDA